MDRSSSSPGLRDEFLVYLASQGRTNDTIRGYSAVLRLWAEHCAAVGIDVERARPGDVAAWLLSRRHLAPATVRNNAVAVRAYYRCLRALGLRSDNPADGLRAPRVRLAPVRPYTVAEVRALLAACRTAEERARLLVLYGTGVRCGELVGMRWGDIDWGAGLIRVHGKGGKERVVAPGRAAIAALRLQALSRPLSGSLWRAAMTSGIRQWLRRLGLRAGVPGANVHRFRHTFAVHFCEAGGSADELQVILGHSTLTMSLHYAAHGRETRALEAQRRYNPADRLDVQIRADSAYNGGDGPVLYRSR